MTDPATLPPIDRVDFVANARDGWRGTVLLDGLEQRDVREIWFAGERPVAFTQYMRDAAGRHLWGDAAPLCVLRVGEIAVRGLGLHALVAPVPPGEGKGGRG